MAMPPQDQFERFRNPPIEEAVIDFRISAEDEGLLGRLDQLADALADRYPARDVQVMFEGRIRFEEDEEPQIEQRPGAVVGYRVKSKSGREVVYLRRVGFTFSRLRPYDSWEALYGEAWPLWEKYLEAARPRAVTRVATRFVNRLRLPPVLYTEDYFTTPIWLPDGVPDHLTAFSYSYLVKTGDDAYARAKLESEASKDPDHSLVLFDIDCYVNRSRPPNDADIPDDLAKLRDIKNRIFFETLTPKTKELFR